MPKFRFSLASLAVSIALFLLLLFIAVYVKDKIVRPFLGDTIAVIWLYFTFKTILEMSVNRLVLFTLFVAYTLEFCQYIHIVDILGLGQNRIASIVLGSTFDPMDLIAYTLGGIAVVVIERLFSARISKPTQAG